MSGGSRDGEMGGGSRDGDELEWGIRTSSS